MKKLSKKIFWLPLCALIANPFSAAFAVKTDGKTEKEIKDLYEIIEYAYESDEGVNADIKANMLTNFLRDLLHGDYVSNYLIKSGLLFLFMDKECAELATPVFRGRRDLKEVFDAQIAECSDLLHRVNLSEGDRGCLNFIFTTWIADIFKDIGKYPMQKRLKHLLEEFTCRLMSNEEVRRVCDGYTCGNELLTFLYDVSHKHLDTSPALSMYSLFHCLKMLLA